MTLTTESLGRPVADDGKNTFPGSVASEVFEVTTTAITVFNRLTL